MHRKLLTSDQLKSSEGISEKDKALIEEVIDEHFPSDETKEVLAARGFLAQQFIDLGSDDDLRSELGGTLASFMDGWNWCKEHGGA